jgi:hypothetical protein
VRAFDPTKALSLPLRRHSINHAIDLDGSVLRPKIYGLTRIETKVVKAYINEILGKGFIYLSTLPYAVLVLVVKKLGGGLRIYINYWALN